MDYNGRRVLCDLEDLQIHGNKDMGYAVGYYGRGCNEFGDNITGDFVIMFASDSLEKVENAFREISDGLIERDSE